MPASDGELHVELVGLGAQLNPGHEQRDDLQRVRLPHDLVHPELDVLAVEHGRALLELRQLVGDRLALRHEGVELRGHGVGRPRLGGEVHHARLLAVVLLKALAQSLHRVEVVGQRDLLILEHEVGDDARHVVGGEETLRPLDDPALHPLLRDCVPRGGAPVVRVLPPALPVPAAALVAVSLGVEQLAAQKVLHRAPPLPGPQREAALHPVEHGGIDYRGHSALDALASVLVHARVLLVAKHLRDRLHREGLPPRGAPGCERVDYLGEAAARVVHLERRPHRPGLVLADVVEAVLPEVVAEDAHPVVLALEGVAVQAAPHVLREVRRVVLRHALEHGLQKDAVGAVLDALRGGDDPHAVPLELRLVDGAVVAVAREAVGLVHVDLLEPPARAVRHHLRKRGAVVGRGARRRPVGVYPHDAVALARRLLGADAHLVLYRLLALPRRGVARVYRGVCHIMFTPPGSPVGILHGLAQGCRPYARGFLYLPIE